MKATGIEIFEELTEYHNEEIQIKDKYPKLRSFLERVCKDLTSNEGVQFTNFFARLNYVCTKTKLDKKKTYLINSFRINANKVLHADFIPTEKHYLQDLKAISNAISHFYGTTIPAEIQIHLPATDSFSSNDRPKGQKHPFIRVEVISTDDTYIYAYDEDAPTEEPIRVKHHVSGINEEFNSTIAHLWEGAQLNLLDVTVDENGIYFPDFIVLEPDYLIDISSLAECYKEEGNHPLNYYRGRLETMPNKHYLLLGNIANLFLDELINETPQAPVIYGEVLKKAFKQAPFEFSTCSDIPADFNLTCQSHFQSIKEIIGKNFPSEGIDRNAAVLEPSFICALLGIQGRLDLMHQDFSRIIELKAGGAKTYPSLGIKENNYVQTLLYYAVLNFNINHDPNRKTYILYSKHKELMWANRLNSLTKDAINKRNLIVIKERSISQCTDSSTSKNLIDSISVDTLITKSLAASFKDNYIVPQIEQFKKPFNEASVLEADYFHSFYSFVTKEHFLSKIGDTLYDATNKGISALWNATLKEKQEAGEILFNLTIIENNAKDDTPTITLQIPEYDHDFLPNFRNGDLIILYERNTNKDNVTNRQIFKGSIEELSQEKVKIRLRNRQPNPTVLPQNSKYAIECDFLDSSYNSQYKGLYCFLQANQDRKDLILNQRHITQDVTNYMENIYDSEEIQQIVYRAKIANDYFLLIGPPGTGKTSIALRSMVEEFYCEPSNNILLLSYTNRAVDEICDALDKIEKRPPFIRIGSELSCAERHREKLLEYVIGDCESREEVKTKIQAHRIFVGTIASVSGKTELFKLKHFEVAIVDEASQILEPHLVGILSAKNGNGRNAIDKFILIGDHKQLPAVVLQSEKDSKVQNEDLINIGLTDRRNSLFERLYNLHKHDKNSLVWSMLHKQGRMHPRIAAFPNYTFYQNLLQPVPTKHQKDGIDFNNYDTENPIQKLISSRRLAFIPSEKHQEDKSNKTNLHEAKIVAYLVKEIFELYSKNNLVFKPEEALGIITPFRSQIALIRRELSKLGITDLTNISVDTVERFQGSQRDIIIYSFSVNQYYQLDNLTNYIEEDGQLIDRKLNVAITRARKQLFITGNPKLLSNNLTYFRLIEYIRSKDGFINCTPDNFLKGKFELQDEADIPESINNAVYEPDPSFKNTFHQLVTNPIKDRSPNYPNEIFGKSHDYNRLNLIEYGRTNFDQESFEVSTEDKVNLYCFYNLRKHYFSSLAIFKSFNDYFANNFANSGNRITFIDFGCGPLTSGLAFNQHFAEAGSFNYQYVGIDISNAMLQKANKFSTSGLFDKNTIFLFKNSIDQISEEYWESIFSLSNTVIFNFSYLFGNLSKEDVENLAQSINKLMAKFPLNKYVLIYQNSALEKRNRTYSIFRKLVPALTELSPAKTQKIAYRNTHLSNYDKTEEVYYELLSN